MSNSEPQTQVTVAQYLFTRLRQLGVDSIFGVPGDYNLRLLDHVAPNNLTWIGNCNELNAAYAADGYARIKGLSALITTFGVGELSAINGIAGAHAEKAPVVHIVGTPSRDLQNAGTFMHHTICGNYADFAKMSEFVTVAQTDLKDLRTVAGQIDWVIGQALLHSRPVYVQLPDDVVNLKVPAGSLYDGPIRVPELAENPQDQEALGQICDLMLASRKPCILVDGEVRPMGVESEVGELIQLTNWPTWVAPFGKGLVNEQLPNVLGIYNGMTADAEYQSYFQSADLILHLGPHLSDTNTQGFSAIPRKAVTVSLSNQTIRLPDKSFADISSKRVLTKLIQRLGEKKSDIPKAEGPARPTTMTTDLESSGKVTQHDFYKVINPLIRAGDVVLTETGTAAHGGRHFILPSHTKFFTAITWLSIGTMLPQALGAGVAARELAARKNTNGISGRVVLFIGDGSLQMTVQEISTMIREKLDMTIVVLNNDGYTIERAIHGRKQAYNDVATWRNLEALIFFGADREQAAKSVFTAKTWGELKEALASSQLQDGKGIRMLEVFMEREDCPGILQNLMQKQMASEVKEAEGSSLKHAGAS